mmetsp:Transcript_93865/g.195823  ORF Transcript_93865/g.195823 Transcript_93865/m.195823 type:complete len:222 (-) Transcript_93865:28-693(-)
MLYFAATFSEVMPMEIKHAAAKSFLATAGLNFFSSTPEVILYMDMDSTPPAKPQSILPVLMAAATVAIAWRLELHCLFTAAQGTSLGRSPKNIAMRVVAAPAVGCKTLPMTQSPILFASILVSLTTALKRAASKSSAGVSLKLPLPALPTAVRLDQQITTSSSAGWELLIRVEVGAALRDPLALMKLPKIWPAMRCTRSIFAVVCPWKGWGGGGNERAVED